MRFAFSRWCGALPPALLLAWTLGGPATARADPLALSRWSIDGGGTGYVEVGTFIVGGAIGQPDAALLIGRDASIAGGFWIPGMPTPVAVGNGDAGGGGGPSPSVLPRELKIHPVSPTPLSRNTWIAFDLPDERDGAVEIFDLRGALRRTVASGRFAAGTHAIAWDGRDAAGRLVAAGVYVVRVRLGALNHTQKLLVLR